MATVKRINDGGFKRLVNNLRYIQKNKVVMGYRGNQQSPNDYVVQGSSGPVVLSKAGENLAERFAFNSDTWPVHTITLDKHSDNHIVRNLIANLSTVSAIVNFGKRLPLFFKGKFQQEMARLKTPPNAPSTIARKGTNNPMIASGQMRQAAQSWVARI